MDLLLKTLQRTFRMREPREKIRFMMAPWRLVAHMYSAKALLNEAYNLSTPKLSKIKSEKQYFSIIAGVLSFYVGHKLDKDKLTVVTFNLLGMCNWIYSGTIRKGHKLGTTVTDYF